MPITRITKKFKKLKKDSKKAFIPYIMAGDPSLEKTRELVLMLEREGADIIELGVPFSDPLADGPVIQAAADRALKRGVTLKKVMALVSDLRADTQIPIVLMTYYNPIYKYGLEAFVRDAVKSGVDGIIVPDLPPDEATEINGYAKKQGLDIIFLFAPTSTEDRRKIVSRASNGFIYYVSIAGITGSALKLQGDAAAHIKEVQAISGKPVAVGFGVSTPEEAAAVAKIADGVIVGSAIVKQISQPGLDQFVRSLRNAIK